MAERYDFVFALGSACSCTQSLRAAGLQFASFPLDWVSGSTMPARAGLVAGGFAGWLEEGDLEPVENAEAFGHDTYVNRRTGLCHPHDFAKGVPLRDSLPGAKAKYDRRIRRLFARIEGARRVLAVWISDPRDAGRPSDDDIRRGLSLLSGRFPGVEFRMLVLECAEGVPPGERREAHGDGFDVLSFDYRSRIPGAKPWEIDAEPVVAALAASASCADYRTPGERRAQRERERRRRLERFGAKTSWQYAVNRLEFNVWRRLRRYLEGRGMSLDEGAGGMRR